MYAIVDIETTGGNATSGSITEIAIVITDGREILHRFESLVNPMQPIPLFIQNLTGITDDMVAGAPVFNQIAEQVHELLCDKIFIAHNVNFDYSFIAHQLSQHGYRLQSGKVCTVRLSRKVFTGLPSYSLGNLCRSLGIQVSNRHRASGDANATTKLFMLLLENDKENHLQGMLKKGSRESYLPMHLNTAEIESMPNTPGIYYFHDVKGKIVYVGKAKRLQKRVISHFSNNSVSGRKQELLRVVTKISYRECGNELMANIYESMEIKRLWPRFNRSQKKFEQRYGVCSFTDQRGINRLAIVKKKKNIQVHTSFPLQIDGIRILNRLVREFKLCPKMCFLQEDSIECVGLEEKFCCGICKTINDPRLYNKKVSKAIQHLTSSEPSIIIFGQGRNEEEYSCVMIGKKDLCATGFIAKKTRKQPPKKLVSLLEPGIPNEYIKSMVIRHADLYPEDAVVFI
jgi:DNA polymerase-3 subunit epsilon